ncbi:MAG: hypothetical protein AAGN35_07100 [Bacteroidota bacterium]
MLESQERIHARPALGESELAPQAPLIAPPPFKLIGPQDREAEHELEELPEHEAADSLFADAEPPPADEATEASGPPNAVAPPDGDDHPNQQNPAPPATSPPNDKSAPAREAGNSEAAAPESPAPTALDSRDSHALIQGLTQTPPLTLPAAFNQVGNQLEQARENERDDLSAALPQIESPTGLPPGESPAKIRSQLSEGPTPELKAGNGPSPAAPPLPVTAPEPPAGEPLAQVPHYDEASLAHPESLGNAIDQIPTTAPDPGVHLGPQPDIKLVGDLDPRQNDAVKTQSDAALTAEQKKVAREVQRDFGENNVPPSLTPEQMEAEVQLSTAPPFNPQKELPEGLDARLSSVLNPQLKQAHQSEFDAALSHSESARQTYQTDSQSEQDRGQKEIEAETQRVRQEQDAEREKGKQQVARLRQDWTKENQEVKRDYEATSARERARIDQEVEVEVRKSRQKVDQEYATAEQKAAAETKKAEQEAARKKEEAERQKEDESWWDRVKGAVSDFFAGLRQAVNAIFDSLRQVVKGIVALAQKAAAAIIDLARNIIKGLLKAYAEVMKGLIKVALAAFPEVADKFCNLIDSAVQVVASIVDALADGLKQVVQGLLNLIGKALDAILAVYQAVYNALLGDFSRLIDGILKVARGIANLVSAARQSPEHFWGQMSEEILGVDITRPLGEQMGPGAVPGSPMSAPAPPASVPIEAQFQQAVESEAAVDPGLERFVAKAQLQEGDVVAEPVLENPALTEELMTTISGLPQGEHEFGHQGSGEGGKEEFLQYLTGMDLADFQTTVPEAEGASPEAQVPSRVSETSGGEVDPMGAEATPKQRFDYMVGQMKKGAREWWGKNKTHVIAGLIAGLAVGAVLTAVTGGAILTAVPPLLQILGTLMAIKGGFDISKWFAGYVSKSFGGDVRGASISLARGLAAAVIELLFSVVFFGLGAAFRGARSVAKNGVRGAVRNGLNSAKSGVRNLRNGMRGGARGMAQNGVNAAKRGIRGAYQSNKEALGAFKGALQNSGKAAFRNGKIVINGVRNAAVKGARTLDDLGRGIGRLMQFKKFKLRIRGRRWTLYGKVNPYVKLASGEIFRVDNDTLKDLDANPNTLVNGQRVDEVLTPDIRQSANLDEYFNTASKNRLIETLKGNGVRDDEILNVMRALDGLPTPQARTQYLENWLQSRGLDLDGKQMQILTQTKRGGEYRRMRNSFKAMDEANVTPRQREELLEFMEDTGDGFAQITDELLMRARNHRLAKESGFNIQLGRDGRNARSNFNNLMAKLEDTDLPVEDRDFLLDYLRRNPQGMSRDLANANLDLEEIVVKYRALDNRVGTSGVRNTRNLSPSQIDNAVQSLDPNNATTLNMIMKNRSYSALPEAEQRVVKYLMEIRTSGDDYLRAIREANLSQAQIDQLMADLAAVSSSQKSVRRTFRQRIRNATAEALGNAENPIDEFLQITRNMQRENAGQFFESFVRKHFPDQAGGFRMNIYAGTRNPKKILCPDNIVEQGGGLHFREFKHTPGGQLPASEWEKIAAYKNAIRNPGALTVPGIDKPLQSVTYIFSEKSAYDKFGWQIQRAGEQFNVFYVGMKNGSMQLLP